MKLLQELLDPNNVRLNNTQQGTLAIIFNSPTPKTAFDNTSGAQNIVAARDFLKKMNLIRVSNSTVELTNFGDKAVVAYNIADESGKLTEYGQNLIDDTMKDKDEWQSIS